VVGRRSSSYSPEIRRQCSSSGIAETPGYDLPTAISGLPWHVTLGILAGSAGSSKLRSLHCADVCPQHHARLSTVRRHPPLHLHVSGCVLACQNSCVLKYSTKRVARKLIGMPGIARCCTHETLRGSSSACKAALPPRALVARCTRSIRGAVRPSLSVPNALVQACG
jgi:hypothetical protein